MINNVVFPILVLASLTGCNKASEQANNETGSPAEPASAASSAISGYKDFVFGMSKSDVAKLPECIDNYKATFTSDFTERKVKQLEADLQGRTNKEIRIAELQKSITEYQNNHPPIPNDCDSKPTYLHDRCLINAHNNEVALGGQDFIDYEQQQRELNQLAPNAHPNAAELEQQLVQVKADGKAFDDKVATFDSGIVDQWLANSANPLIGGGCTIEFMSEKRTLIPYVENGKLVAVELNLGQFNNERYVSLGKGLADKYGMTQNVSDEQISAFNKAQLDQVVITFAAGQIGLYATNHSSVFFLTNDISSAVPTLDRFMKLVYVDAAHTSKLSAEAQKGKTKANDL
ncbi:hypothetical protein [Methyloradius palustris]|uniref:Uncharacterized protein n=1 Tax=Methyloradius palustris TaxID=2778876 RepID=A0A8D5G4A5_9PROT|nr:hypothetical protein [Methyloradius palustris]BCM25718.1 hypothetical protein ZMTM_19770 [Methyloradius palustris]